MEKVKDKMTKPECKLKKADFIPVYGAIKYFNRTMDYQVNMKPFSKENLQIELNGFVLGMYNVIALGAGSIAAGAAAFGLESLLK